ncbi:MAG: hypothetical protein DRJ51_05905 [Thermoprotei archaeon]|nr:MAG: hypothetical protein DRP77_07095 [Candidatus Poribacteria bacterium]RLE80404.1 MAG: hypothetical protein DRJ51_05905 [Thermoprotei archaeon]
MHDNWYTVSELAALLGVSTETIRRRIRSGEYEVKKEGNKYLVKFTDVDKLTQQVTDTVSIDADSRTTLLETELRYLREQNQMLKERIRELETDKGFLLEQLKEKDRQIAEKDRIINELIPRALPRPKTEGGWFRRLFKRSREGKVEDQDQRA